MDFMTVEPAAATDDGRQWVCTACTVQNPPLALTCTVCLTIRGDVEPPPQQQPATGLLPQPLVAAKRVKYDGFMRQHLLGHSTPRQVQLTVAAAAIFKIRARLAVGETDVSFCCTPPLYLVGVSTVMVRERQQNDSLVNG